METHKKFWLILGSALGMLLLASLYLYIQTSGETSLQLTSPLEVQKTEQVLKPLEWNSFVTSDGPSSSREVFYPKGWTLGDVVGFSCAAEQQAVIVSSVVHDIAGFENPGAVYFVHLCYGADSKISKAEQGFMKVQTQGEKSIVKIEERLTQGMHHDLSSVAARIVAVNEGEEKVVVTKESSEVPVTDETASWKTYKLSQLLIKYPPALGVRVLAGELSSTVAIGTKEGLDVDQKGFRLNIVEKNSSLSLADYVKSVDAKTNKGVAATIAEGSNTISIAGVSAIEREETSSGTGSREHTTYFKIGESIYTAYITDRYKATTPEDVALYKKILQTIVLIK